MTRPALHLVETPPPEPRAEHLSDKARAEIMKRDWARVATTGHRVRSDRAFLRLLALIFALIALWVWVAR